jgi:hypothetical protein
MNIKQNTGIPNLAGGTVSKIEFEPVWFDSFGAKSSCVLVATPEVRILIDPGVAVMQPSFPASTAKKLYWYERGKFAIRRAAKQADVVVISHYHYDHFTDFDPALYKNKLLLAKNPNEYINDSQRERAESFYTNYCRVFGRCELTDLLEPPISKDYPNPLDEIPEAASRDFGDYNRRRRELFRLGLKWFQNRTRNWKRYQRIPELKFGQCRVKFPERKRFEFGRTRLRCTKPLFHGIEFSRVGWIFATIIQRGQTKLVHSSDLSGVYIEDYAQLLIDENPETLILDGPPTYMGFMLIRRNLNRCIENVCRIIRESSRLKLLIYDHHLLREKRYREHTRTVWETGKKENVRVLTAAEYAGKTPVIDAC